MKLTWTTTLNEIRATGPCGAGGAKLLRGLGKTKEDDEPLELSHILALSDPAYAFWCLRVFGPWYAGAIKELMRRIALDVSESWSMPYVVHKYLQSGDEALREAAQEVAAASRACGADAAYAYASPDYQDGSAYRAAAYATSAAATMVPCACCAANDANDAIVAATVTEKWSLYGKWLLEMVNTSDAGG